MLTVTTTAGKSFQQSQEQTLLDAASQAGIAIPYSCKSGRCSVCKCKVISGESSPITNEAGLSDEDKAEGWILSCARTAKTDLLVDVEDISSIAIPRVITLPARINSIEKLAPDVLRINLRLPPNSAFNCLPGQYIDVIGPGSMRRSYSIANAIKSGTLLELHIRSVKAGAMSRYWFREAAINDLLRINGPLGTFFVRESKDIDLFFLATGTGFAPVKAILTGLWPHWRCAWWPAPWVFCSGITRVA